MREVKVGKGHAHRTVLDYEFVHCYSISIDTVLTIITYFIVYTR